MGSRLNRYIMRNVLGATAIVFFVLCVLYLIFTFIAQSSDIGGDYTYFDALGYVLLSLPANINLVLPIVGLLGALLGLGHLAGHSELIAMRAAGVSIARICKGVFYSGCVLAMIGFVLGAYLGPVLQHRANVQQMLAKNGRAYLIGAKSIWLKDGANFILLNSVKPNGDIKGIARFNVSDGELKQIEYAASAHLDPNSSKWALEHVEVDHITSQGVEVNFVPTLSQVNLVSPGILSVLLNQSDNLTLLGLVEYIHYRQANNLNVDKYQLSFWQLFFQPLSSIVLMLIAVPFVFGPMRSSGFGYRLVVGLFLGFVFFLISQATGPVVLVYRGLPFLGAAAPFIVFMLLLSVLILRIN